MKYLQITFLIVILATLFGCEGFARTVKIGEQFTLKMAESARVADTGIYITLNRIGRKWGTKPKDGEQLDLDFSVKYNDQTQNYTQASLLDEIRIGKYKLEIIKTEPFGEGYVIFVVNKNETVTVDDAAASFVERFEWHIDEAVLPVKVALEFPKDFNGLPFYHYQIASQASGVDMTPLLGKKVEMLKYQLKEKQRDHQMEYTIFAHLIIDNGKVVGAWRTDSSPSVPGIYSFVKR